MEASTRKLYTEQSFAPAELVRLNWSLVCRWKAQFC